MTIFYTLLMIYAVLTLIAAVVGFSACIVAGRIETLRKGQTKRQARLVHSGQPRVEAPTAQGKTWIIDAR